MRKTSALPGLVFVVIVAIGLAFAYLEYTRSAYGESLSIALGAFAIDCGSVGQGGGLAPGALPLSGGAGIVFHYPDH